MTSRHLITTLKLLLETQPYNFKIDITIQAHFPCSPSPTTPPPMGNRRLWEVRQHVLEHPHGVRKVRRSTAFASVPGILSGHSTSATPLHSLPSCYTFFLLDNLLLRSKDDWPTNMYNKIICILVNDHWIICIFKNFLCACFSNFIFPGAHSQVQSRE